MSRYAEVHKPANLRGPGDARPTALQIIDDEGLRGKLSDKVFLVTGVSSGIGIETLKALHVTGAHIYGTVRNMPKGQKVVERILSEKHEGGGKISLLEISLDSLASVRAGAQAFLQKSDGKLNVMVCNAAIMASPFGQTKDGFEQQFATNHLSHFLLFHLLKDAMLKSATKEFPSRYVSVSSLAAHVFGSGVHLDDYNYEKTTYDPWDATSLHPGGIVENSGLGKFLDQNTIHAMMGDPETLRTFKSSAQGAATQVYAVSREWANRGGRYLASCVEQASQEERNKDLGMFGAANEGYRKGTYDEEGEERLWKDSFGMVGLEEE
jgi:NAD(P)-dependent dehydrogenase (short-subunit alcohol dehydrogenase family)